MLSVRYSSNQSSGTQHFFLHQFESGFQPLCNPTISPTCCCIVLYSIKWFVQPLQNELLFLLNVYTARWLIFTCNFKMCTVCWIPTAATFCSVCIYSVTIIITIRTVVGCYAKISRKCRLPLSVELRHYCIQREVFHANIFRKWRQTIYLRGYLT